jgi:preprotein translocase subunit SecG
VAWFFADLPSQAVDGIIAGRYTNAYEEARLETGLYIALIIVSFALIGLVILQGRNAGLQARDSSSIYRTKRGLEKTIHQATIALAVVFLILSLVASVPIFGTPAPAVQPTGLLSMLSLF